MSTKHQNNRKSSIQKQRKRKRITRTKLQEDSTTEEFPSPSNSPLQTLIEPNLPPPCIHERVISQEIEEEVPDKNLTIKEDSTTTNLQLVCLS
jgi:hypothetical protein